MKCNKLMQDALNLHIDPEARAALNAMRKPAISGYTPKEGVGIDINSKLETALTKINMQIVKQSGQYGSRINRQTLYNRLQAEGVSKKEIELVLTDILSIKPQKLTTREKQLLKILSPDEAAKLGVYNSNGGVSKTVSLDNVRDWAAEAKPQIKTISDTGYAGYTYDMQGQHNPTYQIRGLKSYNTKESGAPNHFPGEKGLLGWSRSYIGTQPGIEGKVLRLDEFQSDWAQDPKIRESLGDFPIDHNDFKKLMIVDGLDRTLKEGLDTMVIPITRTLNNLVGTKEVSQAYRDLNIGILPKIRKELEKSELLLDIKHVKRDTDNINYHDFEVSLYNNEEVRDNIKDDFRNRIDIIADGDRVNKDIIKIALLELTSSGKATTVELKSLKKQVEDIKTEVEEAFVLKLKDKAGKLLFNNIKEANRGKFGEAQGPLLKELKDKLLSRAKSIDELPEDARVMLPYLDELSDTTIDTFFPEYSKTGVATPRQIKALLANPEVNAIESEEILQNIHRATKYKEHVLDKKGSVHNLNVIQDNLSLGSTYEHFIRGGLDEYEYYKELIPDLPEFYKSPGKFKKYRWDALSVAGTLGLGEAYSKLQEQAN